MNIIELYKKESVVSGKAVLFMAVVSGVAQAALLGIITLAASTASYDSLNFRYFLLFAITFAIVIIGKKYALTESIKIAENIIKKVRVRIADKIRNSELVFLENTEQSEVFTYLTQNTSLISEASLIVINAFQSSVVLVFCIILIAILSKLAFLVIILAVGAALIHYLTHEKELTEYMRQITVKESQFFKMLNQMVEGFKELKMNRKMSEQHFGDFSSVAEDSMNLKIEASGKFTVEIMSSQIFFYTLLGIVTFVLPRFVQIESELLIRVVAAILFIIGPVNLMLTAVPTFARANNAVENLYNLEARLDEAARFLKTDGKLLISKIDSFSEIRFRNTCFSYTDRAGNPLFTVGPAELTIRRGEILFIVGGNGSGKTTFLKLLCGLYYPVLGSVELDGTPLDKTIYPAYRELFSVIFGDFYLFDRLYGLDTIDYDKIAGLLKLMCLEKKTECIDGEFTNINLSTGQRKRLAMVAALLNDRPIYVFDEWAADQDPEFRKYFYESLIKELREMGKTIIAVSHDDRYFHHADRVLKMDYGIFKEMNVPK
jgi:putative ATP-binding cassette transporter